MVLRSRTFAGDPALEACLVNDSAHVKLGAKGNHVSKIQGVVMFLDGVTIAQSEIDSKTYGLSTADAVLAYKRKRAIINKTYQQSADNIVGKMTIQALDDELMTRQADHGGRGHSHGCTVLSPVAPPLRLA